MLGWIASVITFFLLSSWILLWLLIHYLCFILQADQPQIVGKRKLTKSPLTDAVDNFAYDGISHKRRDYRQRLGSPDTLTIMPSPLNEPQSSSNENSITFNDSDMETDNSSARVSSIFSLSSFIGHFCSCSYLHSTFCLSSNSILNFKELEACFFLCVIPLLSFLWRR